MKLNTKIHLLCGAEDAINPKYDSIANPYFSGKHLVATNGKAIAYIPADELQMDPQHPDTPGYIPISAIKEARKQKRAAEGYVSAISDKAVVDGTKAEYPRNPRNHEFPKVALAENFALENHAKNHIKISINPELLWNLAQAIGAETGVGLEIPCDETGVPNLDGIKVVGKFNHSQAHGVLLPLRA